MKETRKPRNHANYALQFALSCNFLKNFLMATAPCRKQQLLQYILKENIHHFLKWQVSFPNTFKAARQTSRNLYNPLRKKIFLRNNSHYFLYCSNLLKIICNKIFSLIISNIQMKTHTHSIIRIINEDIPTLD